MNVCCIRMSEARSPACCGVGVSPPLSFPPSFFLLALKMDEGAREGIDNVFHVGELLDSDADEYLRKSEV